SEVDRQLTDPAGHLEARDDLLVGGEGAGNGHRAGKTLHGGGNNAHRAGVPGAGPAPAAPAGTVPFSQATPETASNATPSSVRERYPLLFSDRADIFSVYVGLPARRNNVGNVCGSRSDASRARCPPIRRG